MILPEVRSIRIRFNVLGHCKPGFEIGLSSTQILELHQEGEDLIIQVEPISEVVEAFKKLND